MTFDQPLGPSTLSVTWRCGHRSDVTTYARMDQLQSVRDYYKTMLCDMCMGRDRQN